MECLPRRESSPQTAIAGVLGAASLGALGAARAPPPAIATGVALRWALATGLFVASSLSRRAWRARYGRVYAIARGGAMLLVWPVSVLAPSEPASLT